MKLLELGLIAYGPFTDVHMDFKTADNGFHLIYGPNEAGKSSALRAISHLLYGIPERSPDNFRHAYNKLRIHGLLQKNDGQTLEIIRRKGRRDTLRGADDVTVVEESILSAMMGDVDLGFFKTMFGIGHEDLVRGGAEILKGEGRIGRIIFAAGAGIADFRRIEEEIQSEAETLFLPHGKKPQINQAISQLKQINKDLRHSQLSAREWQRHAETLDSALAEKSTIQKRLDEILRKSGKLRRIQDALPLVSTRKNLQGALMDFKAVPDLDKDFGKQRRELTADLTVVKNNHSQSTGNIQRIETDLEAIRVPEALLQHTDEVETLFQDMGGYRKAIRDRSQLENRMQVLNSGAAASLRQLRSDLTLTQVEQIRLNKAQTVHIRELGGRYIELITQRDKLREDIQELAQRLNSLKITASGQNPLPDITALMALMKTIDRQGDLEGAYESAKRKTDTDAAEIQRMLTAQTFWNGSAESLPDLTLPRNERIDQFDRRFTTLDNQLITLKTELEKTESAAIDNSRQLNRIENHLSVPTETDLDASRQKRQQHWQAIRRQLQAPDASVKDGKGLPESPVPGLIPAYEVLVRETDEMSDRMRREADRVAQKATLLADKIAHEAHLFQIRANLKKVQQEHHQLCESWDALWEPLGFSPESPAEMRGWTQEMRTLAARSAALAEKRSDLAARHEKISNYRSRLIARLTQLDEKLTGDEIALTELMTRARTITAGVEKEQLTRAQQSREISDLANQHSRSTAKKERICGDLEAWKHEWRQAVAPLGLGPDATPDQANAVLEDHQELLKTLREAEILKKRITGIDRDGGKYEARVRQCATGIASEMADQPVEKIVSDLHRQLQAAREDRARQQSLQKQLDTETKNRRQAEAQITGINTRLELMCREAGCTTPDALPAVEQQAHQRRELTRELQITEAQLLKLAGGESLCTFLDEVASEDPDFIEAVLRELGEEENTLNEKRSELDQRIGSARTELERMDGSEKAAHLAQEGQSTAARIENDIQRYARLSLSLLVLRKAVERYRDRHQGPILKRSGEIFRQITGESFQGVRAEIDAAGEAKIMGYRSGNNELLGVEAMSDGTADQLYLAIRLAGLESYLDTHESIPLIMDDILIHFDDQRAAATLKVLAALSGRTQILFFTHHRHLVELANKHVPQACLVTHHIGESQGD